MPTYEYKCLKCDHRFDHFQTMTDAPLSTCPDCGGGVKRLIGAGAGIIFKGSGFYCTDYKNTGSQSADKNTTAATSATNQSAASDNGKEKTAAPAKETPKKEVAAS
ncbi:MAG: FmdB family zinc ribbon protein [Verrucomicrobiota bacterium]